MDKNAPNQTILDTLRTVEFRLGLKGYNVDEVDEYLEKAAIESEQVQERLRVANDRLRQATERIAQLEAEPQRSASERPAALPPPTGVPAAEPGASAAATEDALQRTLLLAQKFVEQAKRESEAEAAQVVSRAEERARTLLAQAEQRAARLTAEAEERLRDEVTRLEEARARLEGEVQAMSRSLDEQRSKMRASLTEALRWVDDAMQVAPASHADGSGAGAPGGPPAARAGEAGTPEGRSEGPAGGAATPAADRPSRPGVAAETEGPRPQPQPSSVASAGGPERAAPAVVPAQPSPERTQAPVGARLGVLNGGLFEARRDAAQGFEENRLGE